MGWEEKRSRWLLSSNWEPLLRLGGQHQPLRWHLPRGNYFLVLEDYLKALSYSRCAAGFARAAMDST